MLVLLIIFMVAAPLSTVDVPVDLPAATAKPQPRPDKPVFLSVNADLSLALGDAPVARDAVDGAHRKTVISAQSHQRRAAARELIGAGADRPRPGGDGGIEAGERLRRPGFRRRSDIAGEKVIVILDAPAQRFEHARQSRRAQRRRPHQSPAPRRAYLDRRSEQSDASIGSGHE